MNPNKLQEEQQKPFKETSITLKNILLKRQSKFLPIKREHSLHVTFVAILLKDIPGAYDGDKSYHKRKHTSSRET